MQGVAGGAKSNRPPLERGPVPARRRFGLLCRHRDGIKFNRKISIKFLIIFLKVQRLFLGFFWALFSKKCLGLLRAFSKSASDSQLVFILRIMVRMVKIRNLHKAIDRLHLLITQYRFA